jgi:5-methylcytosine-specific restriction endonuclease McrA
MDIYPNIYMWTLSPTELIKRLNRKQCEYCGTTQGTFEVHHIRKLKDVAEGKTLWQHGGGKHSSSVPNAITCFTRENSRKEIIASNK